MKKLINNKYAVTAQMEALFSVVVIIAALGIVIASISTSVEQSNVEAITKDAQAVQIAALLTGSTGRSADGSSTWEQSDFKKLDEIEIGLKADITAEQENILLSSYSITTSPGVVSHSPDTPMLSGPESGSVGTSYKYFAKSSDSDGDQIRYGWDWDGDDLVDEWTGFYESGIQINISHSWAVAGGYAIKVKAQDENNLNSSFSAELVVSISSGGNNPPRKADTPVPSEDTTSYSGIIYVILSPGSSCTFSTIASDPDGDQIRYGWDWNGDKSVDEWSDLMASGSTDSRVYSWAVAGLYKVSVRAKDDSDALGAFSDIILVMVDTPPNQPITPSGETTVEVNALESYTTRANDLDGLANLIQYKFDWGDGFSGSWTTPPVNPGVSGGDVHRFLSTGTFSVTAKARSVYAYLLTEINYFLPGFVSVDSDALQVFVDSEEFDHIDGGEPYVCCFPAGTKITMGDSSYKNIEDVAIGDNVLSFDIENNKYLVSVVTHLIIKVREGVYDINGGILSPTDDHPLFVCKSDGRVGWAAVNAEKSKVMYNGRNAMDLEIGDELFTGNSWIKIVSIIYRPGKIVTYTFSVDRLHNYFANYLLVSNEDVDQSCIEQTWGDNDIPPGPDPNCLVGGCCERDAKEHCIGHWDEDCNCQIANVMDMCFLGGSFILMGDGSIKNIEDVKIGDLITSYNLVNRRLSLDSVVAKFDHDADYMSEGYVIINGDIRVTPNHPVLDEDGNWINIDDLKIGDKLYGEKEIKSLEFIDSQQESFHMVTNMYHNYIIVCKNGDFIIAKNGYPDGGYDEEEVDINLVINAKYSDVLSAGKVDTLRDIDYTELKDKLYGSHSELDETVDFSIILRSSTNNDEVYLSYHPDNGRSISDPGAVIASYSENVLLYSKGVGGEDIFTPCEFKVFVY